MGSFTILTTQACPELAWCHERQPVILPSAAAIWQWLSNGPFDACGSLLGACNDLQWHKVHPQVGNVQNNDPSCIKPYNASDEKKPISTTMMPKFDSDTLRSSLSSQVSQDGTEVEISKSSIGKSKGADLYKLYLKKRTM